jgi:hypothetical protein
MPRSLKQTSRRRIEDLDDASAESARAPEIHPRQRGRSSHLRSSGRGRGRGRGHHQLPVQSDQEEIDITVSDSSVSD